MNSILLAIAQKRGLNVITGPGFQSLTGAWRLIERAKRSGRPVRILYISDFDKAGQHMPVAVARQIEFIIRRYNLDLDIQLIPVALTHEQCIEYGLLRTPIKDSVKGKESTVVHGPAVPVAAPAIVPVSAKRDWITVLTVLAMATVNAGFSIYGWTNVYGGALWPVVALGVALEVGKLRAVALIGIGRGAWWVRPGRCGPRPYGAQCRRRLRVLGQGTHCAPGRKQG